MSEVWSATIDAFRNAEESISAVRVNVTYPGGPYITDVLAVPGTQRSDTEAENGVVIESKFRSFSIKAVYLPREPVRDVVIDWGRNRFVVVHPAGGKPWEWADHYQQIYRIHCEQIWRPAFDAQPIYGSAEGEAYGSWRGEAYAGPDP